MPPLSALGWAGLSDARIVDQTCDWKIKSNDLRRGAPDARDVRDITENRHGASALLLNGFPHFVELCAVAADQYAGAVFGYLEGGRQADTRGRAGDDVGVWLHIICLVSH